MTVVNGSVHPILALRAKLWEQGGFRPAAVYSPNVVIRGEPVENAGKRPYGEGWQQFARRSPPHWSQAMPSPGVSNTGVLCDGLRAIDIDIEDHDLASPIEDLARTLLGDGPVRERSNSGKRLILYRAAEGEPGKLQISGRHGKIEVLGRGQQFVAYGEHPSGVDYEWRDGADLTQIGRDALTAVTEEQIAAFLEAAAPLIGHEAKPEPALERATQSMPPALTARSIAVAPCASSPSDFFRMVNSRALTNLDAWVRDIFPGARHQAGTGAYRISSRQLGRKLQEDLSISPEGIVDFGVHDMGDANQGKRTPIDIVIEHGGAPDAVAGARWLCDRLGIDADKSWSASRSQTDLSPIAIINGLEAGPSATPAAPTPGLRERGRIVDLSRDEEFAPPEEVIRDTIPAQGVGFLGGQSGSYKTFCAIELAFSLMTGEAFAGRPVERMSGVIYCAFEGAGTIPGRVKARRSRLADPGQELPFLMLEGFGAIQSPADFAAFRKCVGDLAALMLKRWGVPLGAIVIDTVAASGMIPEDKENDPGAWQRVFDGLNPLSREHDAPVILIHHYGKSADAGLRGSSNARAGADFVLALTCDRDEITGSSSGHYLALTKSRTAPEGGIASIAAEAVEIGHRKDGSPVTSLVLTFDVATKLMTAKARKPGRAEIAFGEALTEALGEHGELQHIMGDASAMPMKSVPLDKLKDQFGRRYVTGEGDERKKADTIRKQFRNALDKAVAARRCAVGIWGGVEWAWML